MDIYGRLNEIFSDVFDLDDIRVNPGTTAANVEGWDSLNNIRLMASIESAFRIRFTTVEIAAFKNVGDIVAAIERRVPVGN